MSARDKKKERMPAPIIAIVGGGAFVPRLCEALVDAPGMPPIELRLVARQLDRLQIIAEHVCRRIAARRPDCHVSAATSLDAALDGAFAIVMLVRIGGLQARSWDESFPSRFGLVGDEGLGPGGIANAFRTLPELRKISAVIRDRAPNARVLNLIAPLGATTRLFIEEGLDAVGICELPLVSLEAFCARAGVSASAISQRYGGLNHLGWFWELKSAGRDLLQDRTLAELFDRETIEHYGAAPLNYFYEIFDQQAGLRMGFKRRPGRADTLLDLTERLIARFREAPGLEIIELEQRKTPWFDRAVAPILTALLGGPTYHGYANLKNQGLIEDLSPELVVEVEATCDLNGIVPRSPGPLPSSVGRFLAAAGEAELWAFEAALHQRLDLLRNAIAALPLPIPAKAVSELTSLAASPIATN